MEHPDRPLSPKAGTCLLRWLGRISVWDMNRLVRAERTCTVPDALGRLAVKGVQMTVETAYALVADIKALSKESGFYVLDAAQHPEEFDMNELPRCVLATNEETYIDYYDMERILALHDGTNLPDDTPNRGQRLWRQRRSPVVTCVCKHEGCNEMVVVTVEMAAKAIRGYGLLEKGDIYTPSTLCKKHRAERSREFRDRQRNPSGLKVPIRERAQYQALKTAMAKQKRLKEERENGNNKLTTTAPVASVSKASEASEVLPAEQSVDQQAKSDKPVLAAPETQELVLD